MNGIWGSGDIPRLDGRMPSCGTPAATRLMSSVRCLVSAMPGQNTAIDMASIEAISVVFAAVLVWLSALLQNLSNVSERGSKYVMRDRSVPPPLQGFLGRATRTLAKRPASACIGADESSDWL
jgi:hypothetical protein